MAANHPIWNSFIAGELTPRAYSRADLTAWDNGAAVLRNFITTTIGPAIRRFGTRYVALSTPATAARTIGFRVNRILSYDLCITDKPEIIIVDVSDRNAPVEEQRITVGVPWAAADIPLLYYDYPTADVGVWLVCPGVTPHELLYDKDAVAGSRWSIAAITFTGQPSGWTGTNWPGTLTFFQGRSWFGGTNEQPQTFWASKSGEFKNLSLGDGTAADDAMEFTLARRGKIEWMAGTLNLVLGTTNGEHVVDSTDGVITAADIQVTQQSSYGSRDIQAFVLGNLILYVSPDGRKLRTIGYQWEENNWLSRDITFLSEHITKNNTIIEIAWSQQPNNLLWCVTDAGNLVGCTYEKYYDVIGWHRHDTQGDFLSVGVVDVDGFDLPLLAAKRAEDTIYFEIADENYHLDSNAFTVPDGSQVITVPHLADKTVQVLIGDPAAPAVHPDVALDSEGKGTLQWVPDPNNPEDIVIVGLGYTSELVTLPMDYSPEAPGSSAHWMKRWNKIYVRTLDSAKPLIAKDRPPERHPASLMNLPEPVTHTQDATGQADIEDVKVIGTGWDRHSQIHVEQDLPLALTVVGIFGEMSQEADT